MRAHTSFISARPARRLTAVAVAACLVVTGFVGAATSDAAAPRSARAASAKPPAPVGPILFIGDSVGASISWALPALMKAGGYTMVMDAVSGRCTIHTPNRCNRGDAWSALDRLDPKFSPKTAIIELGYNDTNRSFPVGIEALMKDLTGRGVTRVLWIDLSERRPDPRGGTVYGPLNNSLRAAQKKWPQLIVLDWNAASSASNQTGWFIPFSKGHVDLIHLMPTGQTQFANWIRSQVDLLRLGGLLPDPTGAIPGPPTTTTPGTPRPTLKLGASGAAVVDLQKALIAQGIKTRADGDFGPGTARGVKLFQASAGLYVDGIVGPKTWKALGF